MKYTSKSLLALPASLLTAVFLGTVVPNGYATALTGTYTFAGTTTPLNQTGPWNMTSADGGIFAILRFVFDTPIAFQDITDLTFGYDVNLGGIAAGAPRAVFVFDANNDTLADNTLDVQWGPAGTFADPTIANNLSTGNLLALTDVGRYDLTGSGGSVYTDRTTALALAGTWNVLRISLVIDSFGGNNRDFDINSFSVAGNVSAVPEAGSTFAMLGLGLVSLAGFSYRKRIQLA